VQRFSEDHAQSKNQGAMTIQPDLISTDLIAL